MNLAQDSVETDLNKHFSKYEDPLWDEAKEAMESLYEVKRVKKTKMPQWKVFANKELLYVIDSAECSQKQIDYLLTIDGFRFILKTIKAGAKTFDKFMEALNAEVINR
jgi:hypothetical protein